MPADAKCNQSVCITHANPNVEPGYYCLGGGCSLSRMCMAQLLVRKY